MGTVTTELYTESLFIYNIREGEALFFSRFFVHNIFIIYNNIRKDIKYPRQYVYKQHLLFN